MLRFFVLIVLFAVISSSLAKHHHSDNFLGEDNGDDAGETDLHSLVTTQNKCNDEPAKDPEASPDSTCYDHFTITECQLINIMGGIGACSHCKVAELYDMNCPARMAAFLAQVRFATDSLNSFDTYDGSSNLFGALSVTVNEVQAMCESDIRLKSLFTKACQDLQNDIALTKIVLIPSVVKNVSDEQHDVQKQKAKLEAQLTEELLGTTESKQANHRHGRNRGGTATLADLKNAIGAKRELISTIEKSSLPPGFKSWSKSRKEIWALEHQKTHYKGGGGAKAATEAAAAAALSPVVLEVDTRTDLAVVNSILDADCKMCSSAKFIGPVSNTQHKLFWSTAMYHWTTGTARTFPSQCGNLNKEADKGLLVPNVTLPLIGNGASNPTPGGYHRISWCLAGGHEDFQDAAARIENYRNAIRFIDGLDENGAPRTGPSGGEIFIMSILFLVLGFALFVCYAGYKKGRMQGEVRWINPLDKRLANRIRDRLRKSKDMMTKLASDQINRVRGGRWSNRDSSVPKWLGTSSREEALQRPKAPAKNADKKKKKERREGKAIPVAGKSGATAKSSMF